MKAKMKMYSNLLLALLFCTGASVNVLADPVGPLLSVKDRNDVIQTLAGKIQKNYVFPDVAAKVGAALSAKTDQDAYNHADSVSAFGGALSKDLREAAEDKHFRVFYDPQFQEDTSPEEVPTPQEMDKERAEVAQMGFGIEKLQRLPGNVGYLEVRSFAPTEFVSAAYTSAMALLAGTDALILDLRRNSGGVPTSVAALLSHFFPAGDERHLNDLYWKNKDMTQQFWTLRSVTERYSKPVYVLTSPRTFSGGEECAYDFQTQKRATLIGETTGGGANPGELFSLGHGMVAFIPTGLAINPVTHTNWEHVGVKPDIAVPAAQAQQTAYVAILRSLVAKASDQEERDYLQKTLTLAEQGKSEAPVYVMRH